MLEFLSDGRLADSPSDLTLDTLTVTRLLHWSMARRASVQGELTYGMLQNVQVAMQRGIAYILSISSLPVTNGALHVPPPGQCWDSCAIYIAHFYVLYKTFNECLLK